MKVKELNKIAFCGQEFRALENDGEKFIEGHAAVFDVKTNIGGWFDEVIDKGAFDGTDFRDVALFVNHGFEQIPLARSRRNNGNSTMTLSVDDVGLKIRAKLDVENNPDAKTLYSSVERGDISGMSFCFRVDSEEWLDLDSDMPTRRIKKIAQVYEVSACTYPAYETTDIQARAAATALENAKKALDNARADEVKQLEIYKVKNRILGGIFS